MRLFPGSWTLRPLNEVCSEIVDCINKTAPTTDIPTPYKMIRTTNVKNGRINLDDVNYVTQKTFQKWTRRALPRRLDVILTREAPLGEVGLVRSDDKVFLGQRTVLYRANGLDLHQVFLYYSLIGPTLQAQIKSLGSGSTVEHLRVPHVEALKIPLPPFSEQQKIAAVLSAYDDLIENNKRRIALLEKMAEEIYREWFVRMRFPGHEKVRFEKGMPNGWNVSKVKSIVARQPFGKIYRENELYEIGKVIVIDQSQADFIGFYDGEPQHKATPESPIILFGDHSCKMLLIAKPFSLAENVIPFTPKGEMPAYFLYHLIKDLAKTTEYKRHWTELTNKEVLLPSAPLQMKFEDIAKPSHQQKNVLEEAIRSASKTRNMLLARLISGKLSVENLDIQFPPSMQAEIENAEQETACA